MTTISGESLDGVSATALWTLRSRAIEAKRPNGLISDRWAARAFDTIDYDYEKFGKPRQFHVLRALAFDALTRDFLNRNPTAAVVALAEGLQTSYWRLGLDRSTDVTWYSVDLPPVIALRQQLLPGEPGVHDIAASALDRGWMDRVDTTRPVLITAEGLLMYLPRHEAVGLIADCAQRFPGGEMIFDSIPKSYSRQSVKGLKLSPRYTLPAMPFSLSADETADFADSIPGVRSVRSTPLPPGRGAWRLSRIAAAIPVEPLRSMGPTVLTFG